MTAALQARGLSMVVPTIAADRRPARDGQLAELRRPPARPDGRRRRPRRRPGRSSSPAVPAGRAWRRCWCRSTSPSCASIASSTRLPALLADAAAISVAAGSNLVAITGPSRTADIEHTLSRGVHGPGEVHVILLEV